ncbi:aldehyde dehydrogenase family protein [Maritimibacter sp. DP07]|uniref:Aldehyde dehydrogenase family protein n=1 Tax=Maritimibacter harenae TaxID=2606218 RepID=A0A845M2G3_9RHOB|nr:aldehyde dehydrogenase [Maritimibacter harenae]MZR11693.1 aldehyde dehydrogenase family protein [Maritimibacter harenae]
MNAQADISIAQPHQLYIGGVWQDAAKGGRIEVISAHSEEVVATVAEAGEADMNAAVAAARRAFDAGPWPRMTPAERAGYLTRMSEVLERRLAEIERAWVEQIGALAKEAPFVIGGGKGWFDYYAGLAETFAFEKRQPLTDGPGEAVVVREPVGVAALIAPWNNPFGIMAGKLAPALLAGCTTILKPAPETPLEAYIIAEVAEEVGLPKGVVNLVTAGRQASDYLVRHGGVDKVSFTGSVQAGKRIASVCGERLARCTLELGGKSAAIVLDDCDIDMVSKTLARVISISAGQVCATLSRAIVPAHMHDKLAEAIAAEMATIRVGHPDDPEAEMGPLAMDRQRARVEEYIALGRSEGAQILHGGARPAALERGYYIEPTLFSGVAPGMRIAQEEIFGPVLGLMTYESEEEALAIANDSPFGLYGAVFTGDSDRAYRIARGVRTGTVAHNGFRFDPALPFGGFKQSGVGREGGESGLLSFTETKSIILPV